MSESIPSSKFDGPGKYAPVASSATHALREVLNSFNDLQRHIAHQLDLGLNDVAALEHLIRNPELGPASIASLLGITTASATVLVDRLENAGHVERHGHPQDRRRKQLVVTDHAQEEVFRALQPLFEMHRSIDKEYSEAEQAVIESYLQRVSQNYRRHVQADSGEVFQAPTATH
ncbi:MAG: MarR family winged helix-turn-helix transcriptional regulator [Propionibacteriaceae bacterium]|nr:MarR family winged helix-turn-helix transcriptional regulator [Propionibacteriaceae bacterium]